MDANVTKMINDSINKLYEDTNISPQLVDTIKLLSNVIRNQQKEIDTLKSKVDDLGK